MKPYSCDHCRAKLSDRERATDKNGYLAFGSCCISCARRLRIQQHYHDNKARYAESSKRRRHQLIDAVPAWYGEFDALVISEAYELCAMRRYHTGIAWHVDHMVPLRAKKCCGLHCADNIQVIPAAMNLAKSSKMTMINRNEWVSIIANYGR